MEFLNRKRWLWVTAALLMAVSLLIACANDASEVENTEGGRSSEQTDVYPLTLTDDAGHEVTLAEEPQTIVTLQASITEVAFALGLGDQIVGVSDFCDYPEEALDRERLGGQDIKDEALLDLNPDVVFVSMHHHDNHADVLELFRRAGVHIIVVDTNAVIFEDIYANIELIAAAMGITEEATELISSIKEKLADLKDKAEQVDEARTVWLEVSPAPQIFTTGSGTYMHEMLQAIGAVNAAEHVEGWAQLTEEEIVVLQPDVIITTYGDHTDSTIEQVSQRNGWSGIPAVANERIFDVDNNLLVRPGPRVADGVEMLAKTIYPEVFSE